MPYGVTRCQTMPRDAYLTGCRCQSFAPYHMMSHEVTRCQTMPRDTYLTGCRGRSFRRHRRRWLGRDFSGTLKRLYFLLSYLYSYEYINSYLCLYTIRSLTISLIRLPFLVLVLVLILFCILIHMHVLLLICVRLRLRILIRVLLFVLSHLSKQ